MYRAPESRLSWLPYRFLTVAMERKSVQQWPSLQGFSYIFSSFFPFLPSLPGLFSPLKTSLHRQRDRPGKKGKEGKEGGRQGKSWVLPGAVDSIACGVPVAQAVVVQ